MNETVSEKDPLDIPDYLQRTENKSPMPESPVSAPYGLAHDGDQTSSSPVSNGMSLETAFASLEEAPSAVTAARADIEGTILMPIPDDAPEPPGEFPGLGRPSMTWTYRDEAKKALFHVLRFEAQNGEKKIRPLTFWQEPNGKRLVAPQGSSAPSPPLRS